MSDLPARPTATEEWGLVRAATFGFSCSLSMQDSQCGPNPDHLLGEKVKITSGSAHEV